MKIFNTCKHLDKPLVFVRNLNGDQIKNHHGARSVWRCPTCYKKIFRSYEFNPDDVSDGYHTFGELYHHRAVLFAVVCNQFPDLAWKSLYHDDGSMYPDMFIVGINTPVGPATYHYDVNPYWSGIFDNVKVIARAPKWDGHTPEQAINRIQYLLNFTPSIPVSSTTINVTKE